MRLKLWHITPILSTAIGVLLLFRLYNVREDFIHIVESRKPFDANLIAHYIKQVGEPAYTTATAQLDEISTQLKQIHRSTWVGISEAPGSYLVDNSDNPAVGAAVPDRDRLELLKLWGDSNSEAICDKGITELINGTRYHLVVKTSELLREGKYQKIYVILISNLDRTVSAPFSNSIFGLLTLFLLTVVSIAIVTSLSSVPLYRIVTAIEQGHKVKIGARWIEEMVVLARAYNDSFDRNTIANVQIEQSTSGQTIVTADSGSSAIISKPNQSLARMTGYSIEELEGMELNQICPEDAHRFHQGRGVWDKNKERFVGINAYPTGCPHFGKQSSEIVGKDRPVDVITKSGQIRRAKLGVYLISSSNDKYQYAGVLTDVTELIDSQIEIEQLYRGFRHDVLINIKGVFDTLSLLQVAGFTPQEEYSKLFQMLTQKADRSYTLCSTIGKLGEPLKLEFVSVRDLLSDIKVTFSSSNVAVNSGEDDILICVDRNAFSVSVLNNLVANAIKYSNPPNENIMVGVKKKASSVVIYIKDNGTGLSPEDIDKIFNNYGASARLNPDIPGSGTGLNTVQRVLKAHKLTLSVKSSVGKGSLFSIEIPIQNQ
jgi:Histidine kinase-, DNA gyrase B-, and HSP90-like ATPase